MNKWFITKLEQPVNGHLFVVEDGNRHIYWWGYYDSKKQAKKTLKEAKKSA